jgi:hypothetical protein
MEVLDIETSVREDSPNKVVVILGLSFLNYILRKVASKPLPKIIFGATLIHVMLTE